MQELFEAVRESCSRPIWSKGVELARSGGVLGDRVSEGEAHLQVTGPGERVSRNVVLDLQGSDWSCDCPGKDDVCVHVAAGVIALKRAREAGQALPAAQSASTARIGYRFRRDPGGLAFDRVLTREGGEERLAVTLAALVSGKVEGPRVVATSLDHVVEQLLGTRRHGFMSREVLAQLLEALEGAPDVRLDGAPVRSSKQRLGIVAVLEDQQEGFRLSLAQDPRIEELFANGVVRAGGVLHPLADPGLSARELAELRPGKRYGSAELVELVTTVLPSLRERLPVDVRTGRLPGTVRAPARLHLATEREGDALAVLPTIVYGDPPVARVDGGRLVHLRGEVPVRDEASEDRLSRRLQQELGLSPGRKVQFEGEEALSFAEKLRSFRAGIEGEALAQFHRAPPLVPELSLEGGFGLSFRPQGGKGVANPATVLKVWRQGGSLVPLEGGGFSPLPADWLSRFGSRVADLLAAKGEAGDLPASALPDLARLCEELGAPPPPGFERLKPLIEGFERLPEPALPADLRAELRPYQRHGVAWLSFLRDAGLGALLADDMGLGKTLQAACTLGPGSLVVAPTSVLPNWAKELARFRPGLTVSRYHGASRALDPKADVTLTTYALLRLDADLLASRRWSTVVLDEAQAIKNPDSQVARAAYRLQAEARVCLSGTPVENRLEELWSELHFLNRGLLGGRKDFDERYAKPIGDGAPGSAERLRARIGPFVLRRLKRDVAPELPPRTELVLPVALAEEERKVYEAVRAATLTEVVERLREGGSVLQALEALLRLRQAACHVGLVPGQTAESSSKVELLVDRLSSAAADGHKALVFSQWTSLLDRVQPHLDAAGIAYTRLDGSTVDREGVVNTFQAESGPPVLLLSLKAGGTGLNLTAADHVFLLDPWWNPAVEDQAADRAHRIGQDRPVFVHRLVAEDTVEERILALQQKKRALAEAALGGASAAASLTRDDLLELLR